MPDAEDSHLSRIIDRLIETPAGRDEARRLVRGINAAFEADSVADPRAVEAPTLSDRVLAAVGARWGDAIDVVGSLVGRHRGAAGLVMLGVASDDVTILPLSCDDEPSAGAELTATVETTVDEVTVQVVARRPRPGAVGGRWTLAVGCGEDVSFEPFVSVNHSMIVASAPLVPEREWCVAIVRDRDPH